jgi:glutathione S-transferase
VILYTCGQKKRGAVLGPAHPCAWAAKALDDAGYTYEIKALGSYRLMPWTRRNRGDERAEVKRLSGTNEVPVLVLDDGTVISDSRRIVKWAKEHPRAQSQ